MDNNERPINERVAVLETLQSATTTSLNTIEGKLDELLQLKAKGMGALSLVSVLIGSGILGVIALVWQFFTNRPHL